MYGVAAFRRELLGIVIVAFAVHQGYRVSTIFFSCGSTADCLNPEGWPEGHCYEGACYARRLDARCKGKDDLYQLGDNQWCFGQKAATNATVNKANRFVSLVLQLVTGPRFQPFFLKAASWSPALMAQQCERFRQDIAPGSGLIVGNPEAQDLIVRSGAAASALDAMQRNPSAENLLLSCKSMLLSVAAWSAKNQGTLGEMGAMEVVVGIMRRFGHDSRFRESIGELGFMMDFSPANQNRFLTSGGLDLLFELATTPAYRTEELLGAFECILSVQSLPDNRNRSVGLGYFEITLQAMKDFPLSIVRGEAIYVINVNYLDGPQEWRNAVYDLGISVESIKILKDEPDANANGWSHDPLGMPNNAGMLRVLCSALRIFQRLAETNATHREALHSAGVVEEIAAMLARVGDLTGTVVFGVRYDLLAYACGALSAFTNGTREGRVMLENSGVLDTVADLMHARGNRDTDGWLACSTMHQHLNGEPE